MTALATPLVTEDAATGTEVTAAPIEMRIDLPGDGTVDSVVHGAVDWAEIVPLRSPGTEVLGAREVDSSRVDVGSTRWEPGEGMSAAATRAAAASTDDDIAVLHSDEERFSDLVRRHHRRFAHLAFVLCGDREQAEDAVADAYARVWPQYRRGHVEDPVAYIRGAVVNQVRGGFRRRFLERREESRQRVDWREGVRPEASVDDRDLLGPALLRLPPAQRTVVVLRFLEDLSEDETAALLGVKVGTVKSRCSRGIEQLRRLLDESGRDG